MYARLLRFLRPHAGRLAGAVLANVGAAVMDVFTITLLIPFLNAFFGKPAFAGHNALNGLLNRLIGSLLAGTDPLVALGRVILIIVAAVALKSAFAWMAGSFGATLQEYVTRDMRNAVYAHLQRLPLAWFGGMKTGQVLARVLNDTAQTKQVITEVATRSLLSAATVVTTVVGLLLISWKMTAFALVGAPLFAVALQPLLRRLRRGYRAAGDQQGDLTSIVQESVSGARLVKAFRGEAYEEARFREASEALARESVRVARVSYLAQPVVESLSTLIAVGVLWFGVRQVMVSHTLASADLITFLLLVMRLLQPLKQLSQVPTTAQQSLAAADRVFEILDAPTEDALDRGTRAAPSFAREVAFENVSFAYPVREGEGAGTLGASAPGAAALGAALGAAAGDRLVLRNVSFTARRGQTVALVGPSGAGKSTLVDLIPRFVEPTAGRVLVDGVDARDIRLPALRALVGVVSQDTVLFNDTVRANLAYGSARPHSAAQVEAAARAANAHGFITELPRGYDTVLGERGARLSGGQRQRLAIARALLADAPILILDEATSALDTESERLVQEAIDRLLVGRTVFVIAHRLSTVAHADQILVLDRGRLVERGTHAELLAAGGTYARLHALQFRAGERAA